MNIHCVNIRLHTLNMGVYSLIYVYVHQYTFIYVNIIQYTYIYIYVYIYICTEKATTSAADLWDPMLGCLDACMLVFWLPGDRFGKNVSHILEAFDHFWCMLGGPGATWAPLE